MADLALTLTGTDTLASTTSAAASALDDLTATNRDAGDFVLGATKIPYRTGALAASAYVDADAAGVSLIAGGPTAPYVGFVYDRDPFFTTALTARLDDVTDTYADALEQALALIKGA